MPKRIAGWALAALAMVGVASFAVSSMPRARPVAEPAAPHREGFRREGASLLGAGPGWSARTEGTSLVLNPESDGPLRFAPTELHREGVTRTAEALTLELDASLSRRVGDVTERFTPSLTGLEQTWRFGTKPAGQGALTVRLPTDAQLARADELGLHLSGRGPLGLSYGHATFIDAAGLKTAVAARWADGAIELELPEALLDGAQYPAVLDPVISAEVQLSTPERTPLPNQHRPNAVFNGTHHLVVTVEDDYTGYVDANYRTVVRAMRFTPTGTPVDLQSLVLGQGDAMLQFTPVALASNGSDFFVVWGALGKVLGVRVSAAGVLLDATPVTLATAASTVNAVDVAWNGSQYLVVWSADASPARLRATRVSSVGTVLDVGGFVVSTEAAAANQNQPAVTCPTTDCLVVWSDGRANGNTTSQINAARFSSAGARLDALDVVLDAAHDDSEPDVAWNGSNYLVTWRDVASSPEVFVRPFSSALAPLAGSVLVGTGLDDYPNSVRPRLSRVGSNFELVWNDYTLGVGFLLRAALVTNLGQPAATPQSLGGGVPRYAGLSFDGTNTLMTWESSTAVRAFGSRLSNVDGTLLDYPPLELSTVAAPEREPAVAFDGTRSLVVWATDKGVRATRVSSTGVVLDVNTLHVADWPERPNFTLSSGVDVAWTGSHFFITYSDPSFAPPKVFFRRVASDGSFFDLQGVAVTDGMHEAVDPAVAANGSVVVLTYVVMGASYDIARVVVSSPADPSPVVSPEVKLSSESSNQHGVDVAWNAAANKFLVTWLDVYQTPAVRAQALDNMGALLGAPRLVSTQSLDYARGVSTTSAVALADSRFHVAWSQNFNDVQLVEVGVSSLGELDAGALLTLADAGAGAWPDLGFDGTRTLVAWTRLTSSPSSTVAQRVAPGPTPLGVPFVVQASTTPRTHAALTPTTSRSWLLVADEGTTSSLPRSLVRAVTLGNSAPQAGAMSRTTPEDTPVAFTYAGTDSDNDPLTSVVVTMPAHGTLSGALPGQVTYTPAANYNGPDSFTYKVNDGVADSNVATVTLTVSAVNDAPTLTMMSATTAEDTSTSIMLTGADVDGDALTYSFLALGPNAGAFTGSGATRTYTPTLNFNGPDSFLVTVSDGQASANASLVVTVTPVNDAPTASALPLSGTEDTALPLTLPCNDVDGDALTYTVTMPPTKGTVTTGTGAARTYTPALNTNGVDTFLFRCADAALTSNTATATLTIAAVNDAPTATPQSVATNEDTPLAITLLGNDVDGDPLQFDPPGNPLHGALTGTPPNLTYTPAANSFGPDSFTFVVRDATLASMQATVTITVNPVNDAPVATSTSVSTNEDTPLAITLTGSDAENAPLTFTVVNQPSHGTVTGVAPNVTYTPVANYSGPDSFTFKVNDGTLDSTVGIINLNVAPVNDAPVAQGAALGTALDTPLVINFVASDLDTAVGSLTYVIVAAPMHGTLSGSGSSRTYTPTTGYLGMDTFTFKANDGALDSNVATISVDVGSLNRPPVASSQPVTTPEDLALQVMLQATDPEANAFTFTLTQAPLHGTAVLMGSTVNYVPFANFFGSDAFSFKANDGRVDSNIAVVTITVTPVDDAPVALAQNQGTLEDTPVAVTLTGSDIEGAALTFRVTMMPANGTVTGTPPTVTYTPASNFNGTDTFSFVANDGTSDSAPATVSLAVAAVNDAPLALAQSITVVQDGAEPVTLQASDVDSSNFTFVVTTPPQHGTLTGNAPNLTYRPSAGFRGADSFAFTANDGMLTSAPATVSVSVMAGNSAPVVQSQTVPVPEDTPTNLTVNGSDADGDPLTWTVAVSPSHGTLVVNGMAPDYTYTPSPNFFGADSFAVEASDGVATTRATINLSVTPVNDRPVALAQSLTTVQDVPLEVTLTGTDSDSADVLTWEVKAQPQHGTLSGADEHLTYTPNAGFTGDDSFTFIANDGTIDSLAAKVSVTVTRVGMPPVVRDTVQLNGWSCGCGSTGPGSSALFGALGLLLLAARRRGRAVRWLPVVAVVLVTPWLARAAPAPAAKSAKAKKTAPVAEPVAPAPVTPPPPAVVEPTPPPVAPPAPVVTTPPAPRGPETLVVLDVTVTVPNEKLDASAFYDVVYAAAEQARLFRMMGSQEIATLMGVERQRQLLGCSDSNCFAELAGAVGARLVLQGAVGKVGSDYVVSVRLLDTHAGAPIGRGTLQTSDPNLLLNSMWRACQDALDAAALTRPAEERAQWLARPKEAPARAQAPATSQFGVAVSALGGYQPLAVAGSRVTVGGEVDVSWRIARFDLGAGIVVSPVPGLRLFASFAVLDVGPSRLSIALRGSGFFGSSVYGGGLGVTYELAFNKYFAAQVGIAGDVYSGGNPVIVALLGGLGVAAHF